MLIILTAATEWEIYLYYEKERFENLSFLILNAVVAVYFVIHFMKFFYFFRVEKNFL